MTAETARSSLTGARIAVTIAVLAALYAGTLVLLPGIDAEALSNANHAVFGSPMISRLSIAALGATPLVSAAVMIELLRILSSALRKALPGDVDDMRFKTATLLLGLAFTVVQARGIAVSLEAIQGLVPEPGPIFRTKVLLVFVAATIAYAYAAHVIDREGVGSGLWMVSLVPIIVSLPVLALVTLQITADLGAVVGLAPIVFAAVVIVVTLGFISKDAALVSSGQLLWPAVSTSAAYSVLMLPLVFVPALEIGMIWGGFASPDNTGLESAKAMSLEIVKAMTAPHVLMVLLPVIFVALTVLRDRSLRRAGLTSAPSTVQAALVLAVLTGAGLYIAAALGTAIRLDALSLIMLTALGARIARGAGAKADAT